MQLEGQGLSGCSGPYRLHTRKVQCNVLLTAEEGTLTLVRQEVRDENVRGLAIVSVKHSILKCTDELGLQRRACWKALEGRV